MNKVKNKNYLYLFIIALVVFLIVFASDKISFVLSVFAPVFYGVVIAYLLDGIVRFFARRLRLCRILSIIMTVVLVLTLGTLCCYYAIPFLINTVKDLIGYITTLLAEHNTGIYQIVEYAAEFFGIDLNAIYNFDITKLDNSLLDTLNGVGQKLYTFVVGRIASIGSSLVSIVTSVIMAIYMLLEKEDLLGRAKRLVRAMVAEKHEERVLNAFTMANTVFKKFIIGKFIDSTIIGIMLYVLFKIFRVEYAAVFSLVLGIGNMIPYFGPIFSSVPVLLILLIINPWHSIIALIIILVVQQLDGNVIGPKILSDNIGVSAFWILFAVTVCGMAFGFAGMIVGVPLVVVIKNLVEDFVDIRLSKREKPKTEEFDKKTEKVEGKAEVVIEDAKEQQSKA